MRALCVFCGSSPGKRDEYVMAAEELGEELARRSVTVVYGGASVGCMGAVADAALKAGGKVIGVIPRALEDKEISHTGLTELHVVDSMHARKAMMAELSDGFIALPGGMGTLEEVCEILTWGQLGLHQKPCGLLNVLDYYSEFLRFLDHTVDQKFLHPQGRDMILHDRTPARLIEQMEPYEAPVFKKWVERDEV